uniref:Uncharacterized protein n=1 Tax=Quercus lobata TaxID=97700 RepID=A0A7N2LGA5_QUELO
MLCFMYVITIYMSDINECIENSTPCLDFRNSSSRDWNKNNYSSLCCVNTYGSYYCVEYDPIIKPSPPPTKAITIDSADFSPKNKISRKATATTMSIVHWKSTRSPNRASSETQQETKKTKAEKKRQRFERRLVKYEELPEYLRDNEYILDYYRCEWPLKDAFLNVFS